MATKKKKTAEGKVRTVSEVLKEIRLEQDEVIPIDSILNYEVIVHSYRLVQGNYGEYALIWCEDEGKKFLVRTGSKVIMKKLDVLKDYLPLKGKFVKVRRYYDIV